MRKLVQIISAAVLSVMFISVAASAQAANSTTCNGSFTIVNTGDNSTQTINCQEQTTVSVECTNNGAVVNYTNQQGGSGNAVVTGNNSSGSAVSGTVTNSSSETSAVTFTCATNSETPVTPESPSVSPTPTPNVKPTVLPFTAGASSEAVIAMSLIAAAAVVALSRVAVAAYRHFNTK